MSVIESAGKLLRFFPGGVDEYARKQMTSAIRERLGKSDDSLATVAFKINGKDFPWLFDAVAEIEKFSEAELFFIEPDLTGHWNFNIPTSRIRIDTNGHGTITVFPKERLHRWGEEEGVEKKCLLKLNVSECFRPQLMRDGLTKKHEEITNIPTLGFAEDIWKEVRASGVIPFQLRLYAYTRDARYLYELDLLNNIQIRDFREEKIPPINRVARDVTDFYSFDKVVCADENLPYISKRLFELLFESKVIEPPELAAAMRITERMVSEHLGVLYRRGYVTKDGRPPDERYFVDIDAIRGKEPEMIPFPVETHQESFRVKFRDGTYVI